MKIAKRQAWYLSMFWAAVAALAVGWAAGWLYGVATFAALLSVACAVQFDEGT